MSSPAPQPGARGAVVLEAPAKLNFGLRILSRRADGYHEIETLMLPLDLCDKLRVESAPGPGIALHCEGAPLPSGSENLAVRGAAAACRALELEPRLKLTLTKRIPVAAGLGGGSSDAAAALRAVEQLAKRRLDPAQRQAIARELGADVPFFLDPQPSIARGIGEHLEPLPSLGPLVWLLVALPFAVRTPAVYAAASAELTLPRPPSRMPALSALLALCEPPEPVHPGEPPARTHPGGEAPETGGPTTAELAASPVNDLERIAGRWHAEVGAVQRALRERGARITGMSGSGPTVYGNFTSDDAAREALGRLELQSGARAWVVHSPAAAAGAPGRASFAGA